MHEGMKASLGYPWFDMMDVDLKNKNKNSVQ